MTELPWNNEGGLPVPGAFRKPQYFHAMSWLLIALAAFGGSLLTFFSGFGLGTILLPVFLLFFSPVEAVALTAVAHLVNNLFKAALMARHADLRVVLTFGLAALPGAWLGALLLERMGNIADWGTWTLGPLDGTLVPVKVVVALLMLAFGLFELLPEERQPQFPPKALPWGGLLSGFFGGLSGHQGALRSAFLLRLGLSRDAFIGSGILIACGIDLVRLGTYFSGGIVLGGREQGMALLLAAVAAIAGAWLGNRLLKKVTLRFLRVFVSAGIFLMALALGLGLV